MPGKDRQMTRSRRLKKYQSVYKEYVSKKKSEKVEKPHRTRHSAKDKQVKHVDDSSKRKKHILNSYQKFVQKESKKEKYNHMKASERLRVIADVWNKVKKKEGKKREKERI